MKKLLSIGMILLFLGIAVSNSIAVEQDEEFVDIELQICGLNRYDKKTFTLSKTDSGNLDALFDELRVRLANTNSREEFRNELKWAIRELDELDLLGGMSIDEAEELVLNSDESLTHLSESDIEDKINGSYRNSNCQVVGKITGSSCFDVMYIPIKSLFESIYTLLYLFLTLGIIFEHEFMLFVQFISDIQNNMAFNVLYGKIFIGSHGRDPFWGRPYTSYSSGWMNTYGDNGHVNFSGSFIGTLGTSIITIPRGAGYSTKHIGVVGFSGLCLGSNYIGRAREIGVRMQET